MPADEQGPAPISLAPLSVRIGALPQASLKSTGCAICSSWGIETANGNCWGTVQVAMVKRSSADILLLQDTKHYSEQGVASATCKARSDGWNLVFTWAHQLSRVLQKSTFTD